MSDTLERSNPFAYSHPGQAPVGQGNLRISDGGKYAPQMSQEGGSRFDSGLAMLLQQLLQLKSQGLDYNQIQPEAHEILRRGHLADEEQRAKRQAWYNEK